jgi:DNA-binding NarL/FixJ family response regulator
VLICVSLTRIVICYGLAAINLASIAGLVRLGVAGFALRTASAGEIANLVQSVLRDHGAESVLRDHGADIQRGGQVVWAERSESTDRLRLTIRERQIAMEMSRGLSNKAISARLCVSSATVKNQVHSVLIKLGRKNPRDLHQIIPGQPQDL